MTVIDKEFSRLIVLSLVILGILNLFMAETIGKLVHPRMYPFTVFTLIFISIMFIYQALSMGKGKEISRFNPKIIIFFIPLILAAFFGVTSLGSGIASNRGMASGFFGGAGKGNRQLIERCKINGTLVFNESDYFNLSEELLDNIKSYDGEKIEIKGFVFKMNDFSENQIGLGRIGIWCCLADSIMFSFICETHEARSFSVNDWIIVEGVLKAGTYKNSAVPFVKVTSIKKITRPENPYVYLKL